MAKVITFSKTFPSYHVKAGQETNFVQKFWTSIKVPLPVSVHAKQLEEEVHKLMFAYWEPKYHTIRKGNRFKVGDKFSPRVWGTDINPKSGRSGPYHSQQLILANDVEIVKVWDFEIKDKWFFLNGKKLTAPQVIVLSINDGLEYRDFLSWFKFPAPFKGQIICWNKNVDY